MRDSLRFPRAARPGYAACRRTIDGRDFMSASSRGSSRAQGLPSSNATHPHVLGASAAQAGCRAGDLKPLRRLRQRQVATASTPTSWPLVRVDRVCPNGTSLVKASAAERSPCLGSWCGRRRRRGVVSGSAWLPCGSCLRLVCAGSSPGPGSLV